MNQLEKEIVTGVYAAWYEKEYGHKPSPDALELATDFAALLTKHKRAGSEDARNNRPPSTLEDYEACSAKHYPDTDNEIFGELNEMLYEYYISGYNKVFNTRRIVNRILFEMGAQDHMKGYLMAIEGVMLSLEDSSYLNQITSRLYPKLAECFDTTPSCVERSIRYLIESTWLNGDAEAQNRYFGATVSPNKGKPTNRQFLTRLVNVTKEQLAARRLTAS